MSKSIDLLLVNPGNQKKVYGKLSDSLSGIEPPLWCGLIGGFIPKWGIFLQPLGFLIFLISSVAETNRAPFDLPEADSELVAGYHTEYSSMKFAMFFMAEYANMVTSSCLMTILFTGGWYIPFISSSATGGLWLTLLEIGWFCFKVCCFLFFFMWLR